MPLCMTACCPPTSPFNGCPGRRCPDMAELLSWCGPDTYPGGLPWDGTA